MLHLRIDSNPGKVYLSSKILCEWLRCSYGLPICCRSSPESSGRDVSEMNTSKTDQEDILLTSAAISRGRTYQTAARMIHAEGLISETDFRMEADVSDPHQKLEATLKDGLVQGIHHLSRSLDRCRDMEGVDARRIASLTACNKKIARAFATDSTTGGLGYLAIAHEKAALLLSSIGLPICENDAHAAIRRAATLADRSVLGERHAQWRGLVSEIACQGGSNIRKVSNDLWRDGHMQADDPRMRLDINHLRAMPLYQAPANAFVNDSSRYITATFDRFHEERHPVWGSDKIQKDLIAFKAHAVILQQEGKTLTPPARALRQGVLMRHLSVISERGALNLAQAGDAEHAGKAITLFAMSCTAARRSFLYTERGRETEISASRDRQMN